MTKRRPVAYLDCRKDPRGDLEYPCGNKNADLAPLRVNLGVRGKGKVSVETRPQTEAQTDTQTEAQTQTETQTHVTTTVREVTARLSGGHL